VRRAFEAECEGVREPLARGRGVSCGFRTKAAKMRTVEA